MGIINLEANDEVSLAYKQCVNMSTEIYNEMEKSHTKLFNFIWAGPVSVDDLMAKYGSDAATLFIISSKIQEVLKIANPDYVPLVPSREVTLNADGTVSIGA